MELKVEDINEFTTWDDELPSSGKFGKKFRGLIPPNNSYNLEEMDVTIEVSHNLQGLPNSSSDDLLEQFQNELNLRHLHHKNTSLLWVNMVKVLKGIAAGLSYLHSRPYVICNLNPDNFVPQIVIFKHCVREGDVHTGGTPGYYSEKKNQGIAEWKDDVLAVGILAVQLVTKDRRTGFAVKQDNSDIVEVKHILDVYVPQYKDGVDLAHPSYGRPFEARKLIEMVIVCLRKDDQVDIAVFWRELVLLTMANYIFKANGY